MMDRRNVEELKAVADEQGSDVRESVPGMVVEAARLGEVKTVNGSKSGMLLIGFETQPKGNGEVHRGAFRLLNATTSKRSAQWRELRTAFWGEMTEGEPIELGQLIGQPCTLVLDALNPGKAIAIRPPGNVRLTPDGTYERLRDQVIPRKYRRAAERGLAATR